ncbi:MAG: hypothetical protein U0V87_13750 [Acidobacteriota bacterium]
MKTSNGDALCARHGEHGGHMRVTATRRCDACGDWGVRISAQLVLQRAAGEEAGAWCRLELSDARGEVSGDAARRFT